MTSPNDVIKVLDFIPLLWRGRPQAGQRKGAGWRVISSFRRDSRVRAVSLQASGLSWPFPWPRSPIAGRADHRHAHLLEDRGKRGARRWKRPRELISWKEGSGAPEDVSFLQIPPGPLQSSDSRPPPWREEFLGPDRPGGAGPLVVFFEGSWNAPIEEGGSFPNVLLSITKLYRNVQNIFWSKMAGDRCFALQVFREILLRERVLQFVAHPNHYLI